MVIGPLNGNIHYPPALLCVKVGPIASVGSSSRCSSSCNRALFSGKQSADVLLVAGGERTRQSLRMAGCRDAQFRDSTDSGIPAKLRDEPLVVHEGENLRFVHNGRLVPHKGTDLIIRSLVNTKNRIELDVIGRGPAKAGLERLVAELGLRDRVRFIEWFEDHDQLYQALRLYRGFVFPSLAEANGIVVQEAMMMGLPVICANWGGPALLVNSECGILLEPTGEQDLIRGLAQAMDQLSSDPHLANRMAQTGRAIAVDARLCLG